VNSLKNLSAGVLIPSSVISLPARTIFGNKTKRKEKLFFDKKKRRKNLTRDDMMKMYATPCLK
jgi:hypothetical protein